MKKADGFTLIEILIALSVFAILATLSTSALYYAFQTKDRLSKMNDGLNQLQLSLGLMERDFLQVIKRDVRGNEMHIFSFFIGETNYVEFTRAGFSNPAMLERRSTLKRVAYLCESNKLIRRVWDSLDTPSRKKYQDKILLDNLVSCEFNYYSPNLERLKNWSGTELSSTQLNYILPKALLFNFSVNNLGKMSYIFIIPAGLYA